MSSPLISAEGMFHFRDVLSFGHVADLASVDVGGRVLVPIIDVLALLRIDAGADIVLAQHRDGASSALRVPQLAARETVFLQLQIGERAGDDDATWTVHLWSRNSRTSSPLVSLRAMSFASFVGVS